MATEPQASQGFDRPSFEAMLRRRLFFTEAFEIYRTATAFVGDNRGLYDYGPPGCGLQTNIVELWRKHFVLEEDMLEMDCTVLTPEDVFKTSGHVAKFADWMCKDPVKGDYLRADHFIQGALEARLNADKMSRGVSESNPTHSESDPTHSESDPTHSELSNAKRKSAPKDAKSARLDNAAVAEYEHILAQIDNYDGPQLGELIKRLNIRNPDGDNEVLAPVPFNLMFKSSIGPSSAAPVYLRPETAQGQFLNFRKLLDYNQNSMPFASASVGKSYRNEISPRSGLLRVREFLMAEIEHFVDPQSGKQHARFDEIAEVKLPLLDRDTQLAGRTELKSMSTREAVHTKVVDNETLGYFLARIHAFLLAIGVDRTKLRFRQHLPNEMAHYACDCWDAELLTSYGWIECVGCADRSAYDLTVHMRRTGEKLVVREARVEPLKVTEWQASLNKKKLGPAFRRDAQVVENAVSSLDQDSLAHLAQALHDDGEVSVLVVGLSDGRSKVTLKKDLLAIERNTRVEHVREYVPNVVEPSFGIGRILYSLLEHVYWHRSGDAARGVLSLPFSIAPTKVLLVPLSSTPSLNSIVRHVSQSLRNLAISNRVDSSGASIGKRYSRNDELGTPLGITVDFKTLKDDSITLRERDTTKQVRGSREEIISAVKHLLDGEETWADVLERLPHFSADAEGPDEAS